MKQLITVTDIRETKEVAKVWFTYEGSRYCTEWKKTSEDSPELKISDEKILSLKHNWKGIS